MSFFLSFFLCLFLEISHFKSSCIYILINSTYRSLLNHPSSVSLPIDVANSSSLFPLHKTASPGLIFRHQTNIAAISQQQQQDKQNAYSFYVNQLYSNLLGICREHCKHVQSRKVFDEIPERAIDALNTGRIVHAKSIKLGFGLNGQLGNTILDLYAKCGHMPFALQAFHELQTTDLLAWNSVLAMFSRVGCLEQVVAHFGSMRHHGVSPDQFTFAFVSSACARLKDVQYGKQVHSNLVKMGLASNSFCQGSLIDMYAKCGCLNDARQILDAAEDLDNVSWTAMISGYVQVGLLEEALKLFQDMQKRGLIPDHVVCVTVMNACITLGKLEDAYQMFAKMNKPNVVAWNVLISGNTKRGHDREAVKIFQDMKKTDVRSTRSTLGSILSSIASLEKVELGLQVHSQAIKEGLAFNIYVGSSLINMYAKCRKMEDAKKVFDLLDVKNVVLWNAILGGFAQNDYSVEVIQLFLEMRKSGFHADDFTFTSIFSACGSLENLELGRQLHACTIKKNLAANLFVGNALVDMYGKCRNLTEARNQFELILDRDNVSWNAIIVGYVQEEEETEAFKLFWRMSLEGIVPDEVSLTSIANACANLQAINIGKQVHCLSVKLGLENGLYCGSSLIDMYCKCGAMEDAYDVLTHMPKLNVPAINALIAGYNTSLDLEKAVNLLYVMLDEDLKPSEITYACLVDSINGPSSLHFGKQMHCIILKAGFLSDADYIGVSLLSMYLNCREFVDARNIFLEFPNPKSLVQWTCVISGHAQNNSCEVAIELYHRMRNCNVMPDQATFASVLKACSSLAVLSGGEEIHSLVFHTGFDSDTLIASALIDMYAKCGELRSSILVFAEMECKKTSVVQWNSMIVGFAKNGYADDAFRLFEEMRRANVKPDEVTFLGILTACSHTGRVLEGWEVFEMMSKQYGIRPRSDHCACMIDILGRSGYLNEALEFIKKLEFEPGVMIWSSFLGACRMHRDDVRGKIAAEKLIELEPWNSSPYVLKSHLYASSENWEEVNSIRKRMKEKGAIKFPGYSRLTVVGGGQKTIC